MFKKIKGKEWFNRKNFVRFLMIFLVMAIAITFAIRFDLQTIKDFIRTHTSQAILISIAAYILFGLTFIPTFPLTIMIAVMIGPLQAAIIAAFGNTVAAFWGYQVGKSVGDIVAFEEKKSRLPFGLGKLPIKSPLFMLAARSVPAGSRAYSVVCGAFEVPIPTYLWTTSLMFFLNSAFLSYGGMKLIKLF
jgi:uncharacterized membrane protein YdjX (TVP38/TMEM64 family)